MTKDLEACANVWATKFVDTNLRPHLASWIRQLEDAYPEEFLKLKVHQKNALHYYGGDQELCVRGAHGSKRPGFYDFLVYPRYSLFSLCSLSFALLWIFF
jgi:hypothetical protein